MLLIKDGVEFTPTFGGFYILQAMKTISRMINLDLVITSGSDGVHSGPEDPHKLGKAYDFRSHNLDNLIKQQILANLNNLLGLERFYYFLESPGEANEHFHIQVKKGTDFTIQDYFLS